MLAVVAAINARYSNLVSIAFLYKTVIINQDPFFNLHAGSNEVRIFMCVVCVCV